MSIFINETQQALSNKSHLFTQKYYIFYNMLNKAFPINKIHNFYYLLQFLY